MAAGSFEVEEVTGGRRYIVRQAKWSPLLVALIPVGVAVLLGVAAAAIFANGYWTLGIAVAALAGFSAVASVLLGVALVIFSLTLRERSVFSVTADGIRLEQKNRSSDPDTIAVADIASIHHGKARASSEVPVGGIAGDIAGLMGLALARRSSAVWLSTGHRHVYLARQIPAPEAKQIFDGIASFVKLA